MRFSMACVGLLILAISSNIAFGQQISVYKWVDEQGKAHFTDSPPDGFETEEIELKINTYAAVEIKSIEQRLGSDDKVVMYSAVWCGMCKKAKKYFRSKNIPHKVYDVEKSRVGKMDFKSLGGTSVPIIIVGRKRMNGFNVSRFEKLYESEIVAKKRKIAAKNQLIEAPVSQ